MRVLVIAPHPDDETLGCGGTLLKHRAANDAVSWLVVTKAHEPQWSRDVIDTRESEIQEVAKAYGFEQTFRRGFPAAQLDTVPMGELIRDIADAVKSARPDWVYTVHGGDIHSDHRIIFDATVAAVKSFKTNDYGVSRLVSYETISSTDAMPPNGHTFFLPNVYCDITPYIERKLEIMSLYKSEVHQYPLPRSLDSIKALARFRGATVAAGYAEAFTLLREVW